MATINEEWIKAADGTQIYERVWEPAARTPIKATVTAIHGLGEHIARYDYVFTQFANSGIRVRGLDHRGFGQTGKKNGILGHGEGYPKTISDITACGSRVRVEGVPHFVFGHSMGGGLALRYGIECGKDLEGIVASSPYISAGSSTKVAAPKYWGIRILSNVIGSVAVESPVDADLLSSVAESNEQYKADPLNHPYVSMCTARDIVLNGEHLLKRDHAQFNVPVLVTFGEKDAITSPASAKQFVDKIPCSDKTYHIFDGLMHEPHNERQKDEVVKYWVDWILKRC
ncbi:hypothetical protein HDV00_007228 [Rhizophlyctis rosea]|nr:hypothetical protein HDV00_007228 [Rhizophlyctis rosea]